MNTDATQFRTPFGIGLLATCLLTGASLGADDFTSASERTSGHEPALGDTQAVADEIGVYRSDYREYTPLGDTVTADMQHQIERTIGSAPERVAAVRDEDQD
jgi:hypothetical protein